VLKEQLVSSVKEGHVPHARLFLGAEGSGSLALALAYAQLLQCENPTDTDSCGVCSACSKASKFSHPDIHFSYPTIGTGVVSTKLLPEWRKALNENPYMDINVWLNLLGAENKQGNINKDECLDIVRKLSFKTYEGEYKILIMCFPSFWGKKGTGC
jgi:DNA polymerase-3 subunit delta'